MNRKLAQLVLAVVVMSLSTRVASAQEDEIYEFDGVADMDPQPADPTDWMTSVNWADGGVGGPDPNLAFGPLLPDFGTRVEIRTSTFGVDAPVIGPGDAAQAFEVRIGREEGPGLLTMTGGTLVTVNSCTVSPFTCNRQTTCWGFRLRDRPRTRYLQLDRRDGHDRQPVDRQWFARRNEHERRQRDDAGESLSRLDV